MRTVPMTAASKTASFAALRARLNLRGIELYDAPGLVAELRRLRTRYAARQSTVVNPRVGGSHGDIAQALALAVAELDRHGLGSDMLAGVESDDVSPWFAEFGADPARYIDDDYVPGPEPEPSSRERLRAGIERRRRR